MTECGRLSERIPAVVSGAAEWTPMELQHLAECEECQSEWNLITAVNGLGKDLEESIDPDAVARLVLRRLNSNAQAAQFRRRWTLGGLAAAAAVMFAVWFGGVNTPTGFAASSNPVQTAIELPELDSLAPAELDSVLQRMDDSTAAGSGADDVDLGDLNADELQRVLDTWEG